MTSKDDRNFLWCHECSFRCKSSVVQFHGDLCSVPFSVTSRVVAREKMAAVCSSRDWGGKAGILLGLGVFLGKGNTGEY